MKNMYFFNNKIADNYFLKNCEVIRDDIYKLNNDVVIKKYDREKSLRVYDCYSERHLLQFKDIDINGFSFNKALVYTRLYNVYAIITKYIDGSSIDDKPLSTYQIDDVIVAVNKIDVAIRKLSELNIKVHDIHNGNIIFDGKEITMIDTTEYHYDKKELLIYEKNMMQIMDVLFRNIFYYVNDSKFIKHVFSVHKYFYLRGSNFSNFRDFDYLMNPAETLMEMRKFMEEDFGVRLNTFGDCHKYIDNVIDGDFNSRVRIIRK